MKSLYICQQYSKDNTYNKRNSSENTEQNYIAFVVVEFESGILQPFSQLTHHKK